MPAQPSSRPLPCLSWHTLAQCSTPDYHNLVCDIAALVHAAAAAVFIVTSFELLVARLLMEHPHAAVAVAEHMTDDRASSGPPGPRHPAVQN